MSNLSTYTPKTFYNLEAYEEFWTQIRWVRLRVLYRHLHGADGKCTRFTQWMRRAIKKLEKAGELDSLTLNSARPEYTYVAPPTTAMYLLLYGPNAAYNRHWVDGIAKVCGLPIPRPPGKSRYEEQFAMELADTLKDISANARNGLEFSLQQQVNTGKYNVDFLLKIENEVEPAMSETLVIEFDEDYHKSAHQQRIDNQRDRYHLKKGMRTIRVKVEDMHTWIGRTEQWKYPYDSKSYQIWMAKEAIRRHQVTGKFYVSTQSAQGALDEDDHIGVFPETKQPLNFIATLLKELGVEHSTRKMKLKGKHTRVLLIDNGWEETLKQIESTRYSNYGNIVQVEGSNGTLSVTDDNPVSQTIYQINNKLPTHNQRADTCDSLTSANTPYRGVRTAPSFQSSIGNPPKRPALMGLTAEFLKRRQLE
ncbi:hypothetical protein [Shewanella chilikensis]|uniref:hypothetical protein n=1 Tax=Shewanella chilikensis TaxID=558541 RepID=UPI003005B442